MIESWLRILVDPRACVPHAGSFRRSESYLSTAGKWGIDKLQALQQLFTTGPWLPPAAIPIATPIATVTAAA